MLRNFWPTFWCISLKDPTIFVRFVTERPPFFDAIRHRKTPTSEVLGGTRTSLSYVSAPRGAPPHGLLNPHFTGPGLITGHFPSDFVEILAPKSDLVLRKEKKRKEKKRKEKKEKKKKRKEKKRKKRKEKKKKSSVLETIVRLQCPAFEAFWKKKKKKKAN